MQTLIKNILQKKEFLIFAISFLIISVFSGNLVGESSISRIMTIRSVVENGTWYIDEIKDLNTIDKFFYNGHFYSSKPPLPSIVGSAIYFVGYNSTKINFSEAFIEYNHIINTLTNGLAFAVIMLFFYKSMKWFSIEEKYKLLITPIVGFGTLLFTYSVIFHNHVMSACFIFLAFYQLLKIKFDEAKNINYILCGFFLSLAIITEVIQSSIFLICFFIYLFIDKKTRKKIIYFVLGALPVGIFYIFYNLNTNGTMFPPYLNWEKLYEYEGSYWLNPQDSDSLGHNKLFYLFNMLFGIQGIFLYTPVLVFGFWGMIRAIKEKKDKISSLAKLILISCITILIVLLLKTDNYGGASYGLRWFVICIPCVMFFIPNLIDKFKNKKFLGVFMIVSVVSFIISFVGTSGWVTYVREINDIKIYFPLVDTIHAIFLETISQL
jgi:4-amino-4-deoxy-L-arabinose transferase-like glycosyltransferase